MRKMVVALLSAVTMITVAAPTADAVPITKTAAYRGCGWC